jgi:hypothetical protein
MVRAAFGGSPSPMLRNNGSQHSLRGSAQGETQFKETLKY